MWRAVEGWRRDDETNRIGGVQAATPFSGNWRDQSGVGELGKCKNSSLSDGQA